MARLTGISTAEIKKRALELGASLAGIVRPEILPDEDRDLDEWLNLGYNGSMKWMSKHRAERANPENLLPWCKSIIMVGVNYFTPNPHLQIKNFPKISRYAWGRDYHKVIRKILKTLSGEMSEYDAGARFRIAADSTPFRDKVWARKAGLGWIGKHTLLISETIGSWFFIGAILTTMDIAGAGQTRIQKDRCGNCTKCINACPTGAIIAPYKLDARACISYLTVEHDGEIPSRYRDHLDGWLYGCDICQDVCPWNKSPEVTGIEDFKPRHELLVPDLGIFSQMDIGDYDRITTGTVLRRAGREKLRRNSLASMGLL